MIGKGNGNESVISPKKQIKKTVLTLERIKVIDELKALIPEKLFVGCLEMILKIFLPKKIGALKSNWF